MSNLVKIVPAYRTWWKYPRKAGERPPKRTISFLELFFDLVFVVLISKLIHSLMAHFSWEHMGILVGMFYLVWWAWYNGTIYFDIHGSDDMRTHIITFLNMGALLGMCTFAETAMTTGGQGFALNYALFLAINAASWWRTGVHDRDHRTMAYPYTIAIIVTLILFVISAFLPSKEMHLLWIVGGIHTFFTPVYMHKHRHNPEHQRQVSLVQRGTFSMAERLGLLTIILLGEAVNAIVSGATTTHFDHMIPINGVLGTILVMTLFWGYFNLVSLRIPKPNPVCFNIWRYAHLVFTVGLALMSAALPHLITAHYDFVPRIVQTGFMVGSFIALISTTLLGYNVVHKEEDRCYAIKTRRMMLFLSPLPLIGTCIPLRSTYIIAIVLVAALIPMIQAIFLWSNKQSCNCQQQDD